MAPGGGAGRPRPGGSSTRRRVVASGDGRPEQREANPDDDWGKTSEAAGHAPEQSNRWTTGTHAPLWYYVGVFTGLIEDVGVITAVEARPDARVVTVRPAALPVGELSLGESVAVDGVCLTVTERGGGTFTVLAGEETLRRTTLVDLAPGARVNLERALRLGDRLGGHMVQGHVDGVGRLAARADGGDNLALTVEAPAALLRYVVEKGSITVDGISLTVTRVDDSSFSLALIPHTVQATAIATKTVGQRVNLEVDMIAKYVERLLGPRGPSHE
jgi:riboflavin synthase